MAIRVPWDKYEAALLLDACLEIEQNKITRKEAIAAVSAMLRERALSAGIDIDDVYRNENGISMQLSIMNALYRRQEVKLHGASKLFRDTVSLYQNNPADFDELVKKAKNVNMCDKKNGLMIETTDIQTVNAHNKVDVLFVDFEHRVGFAFTRPVYFEFKGNRDETVNSWTKLYVNISSCLYRTFPNKLIELIGSHLGRKGRVDVGNRVHAVSMADAKEFAPGLYLETNLGASDIVDKIRLLMKHCNLSSDDIRIAYIKTKTESFSDRAEGMIRENNEISTSGYQTERILQIIDTQFANGIRKGSPIELNQLRRRYSLANNGEEIPATTDLEAVIASAAIEYNGRYYVISKSAKDDLTVIIKDQIALGHRIFYYEEFYNVHMEFLGENHIFVADVLRALLEKLFPNFIFYKQYFTISSDVKLETEIKQCFENYSCLNYIQIKEKLPYVTLDKIRQELALRDVFVWVRTSEYTTVEQIFLDEKEAVIVKQFMEMEIAKKGFSSIANQNMEESINLNPQLSEYAVREAFFQKYMSAHCDKNGNIYYPKGTSFRVSEVFRVFCLEHRKLTMAELNQYEIEVTGSQHRRALSVACESMIRVSRDEFVCDEAVSGSFDIEQIDRAISLFAADSVIPLRAVTSFTSFPYVEGYDWNLYLLESFCRRYSRRYRYQCLFINTKCAGAIVPVNRHYREYTDVMAEAVAVAGIPLYTKEVGDFLSDSGYIARRTDAINDVIVKAQSIINRGGQ